MKVLKKLLTGVALAASLIAPASAVTVSGVSWDPDYADAGDADFVAEFQFTQWFSTTSSSPDAISNYGSAVGITSVLAGQGGTGASGFFLQGAGEIFRVNENNGIGTFTASGLELTYVFGGVGLNKDGTFDVSNAWARMHVNSTTPNYNTPASNQAEVNDAQSGTTFLDLEFVSLGFATGTVGNGTVSAILKVVDGTAMGYFEPFTLAYTGDAFFNTSTNAAYSSSGNGSAVGNTIPEPGSLALVGLGLLGAAAFRRAKKSA